jgi:uncharacterized protein
MTNALNENDRNLVARTEQIVTNRLQNQQAGHGMDHVLRVLRSAREIQCEVGGCRLIVELAALLHDVGDAKFNDGVERSAEFSREILTELDAPKNVIDHVAMIVENISFRKRFAATELTLEGKVVQDADRLDALGAIGIVRTIEYGATVGQPFFVPGSRQQEGKTGVGHFYEKLFKLRELLNTEPARRIAGQREQFMRMFLDQFFEECGEKEDSL